MGGRLGFIPWKRWMDVILQLGKEPGLRELGLKSPKDLLNSALGFAQAFRIAKSGVLPSIKAARTG